MDTRIIGYETDKNGSENIVLEHRKGLREIVIAVMLAVVVSFWLGYFARPFVENFLSLF